MSSRTETAGHIKAFIYPVMNRPLGESQSTPVLGRFEQPTCRSTVEHANHQTTMTTPSQSINYTPGPQPVGGSSAYWGQDRLRKQPRHVQAIPRGAIALDLYSISDIFERNPWSKIIFIVYQVRLEVKEHQLPKPTPNLCCLIS